MPRDAGALALRVYCGVVLAFLSLPIVVAVGVAFGRDRIARFPPSGLSLRWFGVALSNPTFLDALGNSLALAALTTVVTILLGVPASVALVRRRFPGQPALEAFLLSPLTLPGVLFGVAMLFFLGATGFGLAWWGLLVAHAVIAVPYVLRTTLAVYRGLDRGLEETAMVLGAGPWQTFWHVTLPLLRPGLVAGGLFAFLTSFDNVPVSIFLTTARSNTLPVTIMSYLVNQDFDPIVGAISAVQVGLVLGLLYVLDRLYGVGRLTSFGG
ncbi:MAG: ABC transporter permease [Candidatus Rokuibacteriota bacterium]